MAKKNIPHPTQPPADAAALEREAIEHMKQERFRRARDLYKILCKQDRAKYLPGLIEANRALADQMAAKGQFSEAEQVMAYLRTIAPPASLLGNTLMLALRAQKWQEAFQIAVKLWTSLDGAIEERDRAAVADGLVLAFPNLEAGQTLPARLQAELAAVVGALAQVSESRFEEAQESLRPLPRASVFADWKMLIKGWIAFYQGDQIKADELWGRLKPEGTPARAAAPFRALCVPGRELQGPEAKRICCLLGEPAFGAVLPKAQELWGAGRYIESYQEVRQVAGFPSEQVNLAGLLSDFYFKSSFAFKGPVYTKYIDYFIGLEKFQKQKSKTESRLVCRMVGGEALREPDAFDLEMIWRDYLGYCPADDPLFPKLASLVLYEVGQYYSKPEEMGFSLFQRGKRLNNAKRAKAVLKESIDLDPTHLDPCLKLLEVYEFERNQSEGNRLLDDMTRRFPGEKAVLLQAGNKCIDRKAYSKGIEYLERAHALDPLDPAILIAMTGGYLKQARQHFKKGNPLKGRQAFAAVERHAVADKTDIHRGLDFLRVRFGVLESIYGDKAAGERLIAAARESAHSLAALLFFAHAYHRVCERGNPVQSPFWDPLRSTEVCTAGDRKAVSLVLQYARAINGDMDWRAECAFVADCLAPVASRDFTPEEAAYYIPLLATDPAFLSLVKRLIKAGLKNDPEDPQFRLFNVLNRQGAPSQREVSELEGILEDARRRGDAKTEKLAGNALHGMRGSLMPVFDGDFEDDFEDDFDADEPDEPDFLPQQIDEMRERAATMSDAEFATFRKDSQKFIPLELFDLFMEGIRGKQSEPFDGGAQKSSAKKRNDGQLDLF